MIEIEIMDLKKIPLCPQEESPEIVTIREEDGFFISRKLSDDFRIRKPVYEMLLAARKHLPEDIHFMIYESYRSTQTQEKLWKKVHQEMSETYPDLRKEELEKLCETFVANPYDGIGSGHTACCAIDVTLCNSKGKELDMGTAMHGMNELTRTASTGISDEAKVNRAILKNALEKEGLVNYPAEWWHYSYGDHQWAWIAGKTEAIFGPIDLPAL